MAQARTDALQAFTVALLRYEDQYLLLQRSQSKQFAPGRWTGLGGHVESDEYHQIRSAALREVQEEAGIQPQEITNFLLRRVLLVSRPHQTLGILLYYTGDLSQRLTPDCPEGTLFWKQAEEFEHLDIIETTRPVLPLLVRDMRDDPPGLLLPKIGMAAFTPDGAFQKVIWVDCED